MGFGAGFGAGCQVSEQIPPRFRRGSGLNCPKRCCASALGTKKDNWNLELAVGDLALEYFLILRILPTLGKQVSLPGGRIKLRLGWSKSSSAKWFRVTTSLDTKSGQIRKRWQPNSNGLYPRNDGSGGLHPSSDGLQPTSNGLQPNSDGLQPSSLGSTLLK